MIVMTSNNCDNHHHHSVLSKDRYFTAGTGTQAPVLPKASLLPQTQEPRLQFYQRLNRCGSFPLLSVSHSLFSIWTDYNRPEKIQGAPTWRCMYVKSSAWRQVHPSTCTTRVVHISTGIHFIAPADPRVLQIQLLSIPIPRVDLANLAHQT